MTTTTQHTETRTREPGDLYDRPTDWTDRVQALDRLLADHHHHIVVHPGPCWFVAETDPNDDHTMVEVYATLHELEEYVHDRWAKPTPIR